MGTGSVVAGERSSWRRRQLHVPSMERALRKGRAGHLGPRAGALHYCLVDGGAGGARSGSATPARSSPRPSGASPTVVLERPQLVGFGTVADLAEAAGAGAATVVRLAAKLGFDGFSALQASIQRDLAHQLRPAAERIRELAGDQPISRHRSAELSNVQATLDAVDPATLDAVVGLLAGHDPRGARARGRRRTRRRHAVRRPISPRCALGS